ncbi:hypothetical protein LWC34_45530 [Kibdelosporangium philippinense]|uniref:MarR family transcriptional regulator n=1 Tax=Kibdelosporangium philippinense TaxID=211113 RepID=A0ABS8ZQY2_9PSEU|nr:hypothetical protein [Kibdelosporangium philippinense]MCE7010022.1 hypothetical protein [Kibdelosporangium philippinense]
MSVPLPRDDRRTAQFQQRLRTESDYHQARLLLLLSGFTEDEEEFVGLTRLVKLDFLLRYPAMTRRLLPEPGNWPEGTEPTRDELLAVESRMIRYRYGPWDDRYYPMLGALVGRGLAVFTGGRRFAARVTPRGRQLATQLSEVPEWRLTAARIRLLREHFDFSGEQLKSLIYEHLDDVAALAQGAEI